MNRRPAVCDVPAELRLCLLCARPASTPADVRAIEALLAAGVDWPRLTETALWHHLGPPVFRTLVERFSSQIPAAAFAPLKLQVERVFLRADSAEHRDRVGDRSQAFAQEFGKHRILVTALESVIDDFIG